MDDTLTLTEPVACPGDVVARPILFSAPMVRALLAGSKTQTRRIVKPAPVECGPIARPLISFNRGVPEYSFGPGDVTAKGDLRWWRCPYGVPGDTLWVRENVQAVELKDGTDVTHYPADGAERRLENSREGADRWFDLLHYDAKRRSVGSVVPAIHMPRWASRITLRITDVRVARLNEISDVDAAAEGCPPCARCHDVGWINSGPDGGWQCGAPGCGDSYRDQYRRLWETINGPGSWAANPWVFAVSFEIANAPEGA